MLEKNTRNRSLNQLHVESLAKELSSGRWKLNGDAIRLSKDRVIDGQHRLAAIVKSGISMQTLIIEDLSDDVFNTIDIGRRRSGGDTLSVLGYLNSTRLAAMLAVIDRYMTGRAEKYVTYSNTEIEILSNKYPDAQSAMQASNVSRGLISPSILDACYYLFSKKDQQLADDFIKSAIKGIDLVEGDAWYLLHERLLQNSMAKAKLPKDYIFAICIKAWNAKRSNTKIKVLKWISDESFPFIN